MYDVHGSSSISFSGFSCSFFGIGVSCWLVSQGGLGVRKHDSLVQGLGFNEISIFFYIGHFI